MGGGERIKIRVRLFSKRGKGREANIFNKTYTVKNYLDYLAMVGEVRKRLWELYKEKDPLMAASPHKPVQQKPQNSRGGHRYNWGLERLLHR